MIPRFGYRLDDMVDDEVIDDADDADDADVADVADDAVDPSTEVREPTAMYLVPRSGESRLAAPMS